MLALVIAELPKLAQAVARSEVEGKPSYDITATGAADKVRETAKEANRVARRATAGARQTRRRAPRG
jgi:hypothetical protein